MSQPLLCLNMIVKNESKIITRLLDSVIKIIDSYCICDTGSTDDTVAIIRQYFDEHKLRGEVFTEPFKNFGYNRTVALKRADKWGQYALLLDADMVLEIHNDFDKTKLTCTSYQVKQKTDTLDYYNTRIIKTGIGATCVGVTHEYYDIPTRNVSTLNSLEVNDIGDGGAKGNKFERDIKLLHEGLMNEPNNVRYQFYLANSYKDYGYLNKDDKALKSAIKWYKRRISSGGWDEELFVSCLEMGNIYMCLGKPDSAIYRWMEGYTYRKSRAESLYAIINYYREKGPNYAQLAGMYYDLAKTIPYPKNDLLFIQKNIYNYLLDYEYSILAYYLNRPIDYKKYLDLLVNCNYDNIINNYKFYCKKLIQLSQTKKTYSQKLTIPSSGDKFYPSTPSIIKYQKGYLINQRYVNYYIEPNGSYTCNYPITTVNRRLITDDHFEILSSHDFSQLPDKFDKYRGIEDVKIIEYKDEIMFLGTAQNLTNQQLSMCAGKYFMNDSTVLEGLMCQSPEHNQCEKNWCHFIHHDQLMTVYKWYPLTIGYLEGDQFKSKSQSHDVPKYFKFLRGSSNGCAINDEIWFMTHMVDTHQPRCYYHMVVVLDANTLQYKRNSLLFKFEDSPIEFCLGLVVEHDKVICGYSKMDRETIIATYNRPLVDEFLFNY